MKRKASSATVSPAPSESSASTQLGLPTTGAARHGPLSRQTKRTARSATVGANSTSPSGSGVSSPAPEVAKLRPRPKPRKKAAQSLDVSQGGNAQRNAEEASGSTAPVDPTLSPEDVSTTAGKSIAKSKAWTGRETKRVAPTEEVASSRQSKRRKTRASSPCDSAEDTGGKQTDVDDDADAEPGSNTRQVQEQSKDVDGTSVTFNAGEGDMAEIAMKEPPRRGARTKGKSTAVARTPARRITKSASQSQPSADTTTEIAQTSDDDASQITKSSQRRGNKTPLPAAEPTRKQPARGKAKKTHSKVVEPVD